MRSYNETRNVDGEEGEEKIAPLANLAIQRDSWGNQRKDYRKKKTERQPTTSSSPSVIFGSAASLLMIS